MHSLRQLRIFQVRRRGCEPIELLTLGREEAVAVIVPEVGQQPPCAIQVLLDRLGVRFILSNSYTPLVLKLYGDEGFSVEEVKASRSVNSNARKRGKISEALVRNF